MEGLLSLLIFALFFYFMMRFGCGAHMTHGSHGGHGDHGKQGNETNHIDPVCGMKVNPDQGYGKMHQGKLYRFCSKGCLEKFDNDPDQYLNQQEDTS